jgi:hypothetical protein
MQAFQGRQVEHDAAVTHGVPGDAVPAAADRQDEVVLAGEGDAVGHVPVVGTLDDGRGPPVDHSVEDGAHGVVVGVAGLDETASQVSREGVEG